MSDRQAAHFYRAQHQRALQREMEWKQKALASENIIAQLLVLAAFLVGVVIQGLRRELAWLKKQVFGRKSESQSRNPSEEAGPAQPPGVSGPAVSGPAASGPGTPPAKRRRGQQPGAKGPKRTVRVDLPTEIIDHVLDERQRTCPCCGKVRPEIGLTEESHEIFWEVRLVNRKHVRHRYGPSCDCATGRGILTAPKPGKLIPKGLFAVNFWVQVLLKKFEFHQPLQRIIGELKTHGLEVPEGTLSGGLKKIQPLLEPLAGLFVLRSREGAHWHMDETRWPMFCVAEGQNRQLWWFWVVVTKDVTVYQLEPSRKGQVPLDFFPPGTEGIVNVDRYKGYFGLLGPDRQMKLAFCWAHQRRDFVNAAESSDLKAGWTGEWIGLINELFAINARRREAWFEDSGSPGFAELDQGVRQQVQKIGERLERELGSPQPALERKKILQSMKRHWAGLTVFVDHPEAPMDNNAAERALRGLAVGRKNYYGSAALWSGELAAASFTILATLRQHGICPRRYLQAYLEACAQNGGRAPENLEEYLPWKWSPEKKAAWSGPERPP